MSTLRIAVHALHPISACADVAAGRLRFDVPPRVEDAGEPTPRRR